ncbi:MAG: tRNA uridine-5-carboxymethylaminomethyl(34) synthesis GTPase MnmE [Clostridia bacterium]|nr:tRNA uridine-5-carboxymethylaminomethyl(34) synthesis GTPase MnmE [Clostridia bacterium]
MQGSIGVIRISGDEAISVANKVFRCAKEGVSLENMAGYTAAYGYMFNEKGHIDDGVALVFRAPHSYTGEDVVELSCHGGPVVLKQLLRAVLDAGAVSAGPGEFTKRAFLNGKLSLTQAEAVMDVISAQSTAALQTANGIKNGSVYKKITALKDILVFCAASVAAYVDFPEEGTEYMDTTGWLDKLKQVEKELGELIRSFDSGALIKNGIDCVIAGKPNVGKSTLMNLLAQSERSIVTDIAGTTRDIVEETVELDGVLLRLSDTAGIHSGSDEVEKIGIEKAKQRMKNAQLVLAVFDAGRPLCQEDMSILESIKDQPTVLIVNKTDLGIAADLSVLQSYGKAVCISAAKGQGVDELKAAIMQACGANTLTPGQPVLANERQLEAAKRALSAVQSAVFDAKCGQTFDLIGVVLEDAISALLELNGESVGETVVSEIFSKFCVGK